MGARRDIADEAAEVLSTCTAATPRPLVAWAYGALELGHAIHFHLPVIEKRLAPIHSGRTLYHGRDMEADAKGWRVRTQTDEGRKPIVSGTWAEVAALMTLSKVGPELYAEIRAACVLRVARTDTFDPARTSAWHRSPEALEISRLWTEIEERCYVLGARAWDRCRPGADDMTSEQGTLFDLAEVVS